VRVSKSSDRSSLWMYKYGCNTATTYGCRHCRLGRPNWEVKILTIREERGGKILVHYHGMLDVMNLGFVLTAITRNPDEDNKEISGDL